MKILKIDSCSDCKHYSYHEYEDSHCMESNRGIDSIGIPGWCPLDDMPESLWELWMMEKHRGAVDDAADTEFEIGTGHSTDAWR